MKVLNDNILKEIDESWNMYARKSNKLMELLSDFEDTNNLPMGITIKELDSFLLKVGIIEVDIIPRCKFHWDDNFHELFCRIFDLKLIRVHEDKIYHEKGFRKLFRYEYTYSENFRFNGISPDLIEDV